MPELRELSDGLACIACGCTDAHACPDECYWVSLDPPQCSACFADDGQPYAVGAPEGGAFGIEFCPASETPAAHLPLFTSETQCHCARCHLVLPA